MMTSDDKPPRRRIKYALTGSDVTTPGTRSVKWADSENNPLSAGFIPLTEREENGKARWWALHARRNKRQVHGVF